MIGRPPRAPLRPLSPEETQTLEKIGRATSERADVAARAKAILAVAQGASFTQAACRVGRRSGDAVGRLVARFNEEGVQAVVPRLGGGAPVRYGKAHKVRILREFQRSPDPERDGTATWSLTTLQRALRKAPDGLPGISTQTIFLTLHEAGYTWQENRTWCETGQVERKRKEGIVRVTDPLATQKRG